VDDPLPDFEHVLVDSSEHFQVKRVLLGRPLLRTPMLADAGATRKMANPALTRQVTKCHLVSPGG